jgi:hypothetical protein
MPDGKAKKFSFCTKFTEAEYNKPGPLKACASLSVCEEQDPPEYGNPTGSFEFVLVN